MALQFSQPERRSYLGPIAIVVLLAAAAAFAIVRFTPHRIAQISVVKTSVVPIHTVFSGKGISGAGFSVLQDQVEDDLYVVVTLRIEDDLKLPVFIKDLRSTVTEPDGSEMEASAVEQRDLATLFSSYPRLRQAAGTPLLRETSIAPGATVEGSIILRLNGPRSAWDNRSSAVVTIDTYHQGPLTVAIPR